MPVDIDAVDCRAPEQLANRPEMRDQVGIFCHYRKGFRHHERRIEGLLGEAYEDAAGNTYNPLAIQPMIVLGADADTVRTIYHRAMERGVRLSLYIEDMFKTGHDAANRETVKRCRCGGP